MVDSDINTPATQDSKLIQSTRDHEIEQNHTA